MRECPQRGRATERQVIRSSMKSDEIFLVSRRHTKKVCCVRGGAELKTMEQSEVTDSFRLQTGAPHPHRAFRGRTRPSNGTNGRFAVARRPFLVSLQSYSAACRWGWPSC